MACRAGFTRGVGGGANVFLLANQLPVANSSSSGIACMEQAVKDAGTWVLSKAVLRTQMANCMLCPWALFFQDSWELICIKL